MKDKNVFRGAASEDKRALTPIDAKAMGDKPVDSVKVGLLMGGGSRTMRVCCPNR